ncbi:type II toxin-antitoxin system PemK/MazF family toxin [Maribacter polysaccharolyticus]|uniref:type II toxin-antitoxin system PemK/MazF family toxin n=1 Tax=Maribacter polysaccharolyticus TaxID=3020831 RepID=UPI00237F460D|nr:type II toxin-antitoxin system PemK/MazF family toxin [Maribacter polysaccharolyticus]MDE3743995.1 type II toxin-antitoxin system PemK/MazF family toxin [Maribacter polysaccharolyticus]
MVKQFEIYWIDLNPTKGSEISKKRPCVVISPKEMNDNLNTLIIAPLTSTIRNYPTRVTVVVKKKKGQVALDQIRSIDKSRLSNKITVLNQKSIESIKAILIKMFK